jgi:hypothetical protein
VELERLAVDLRPRTTWEALDLGAAMLREWWGPILRVWLVLVVPWAIVLALAFETRYWVAMLVLWWSKPVFDRFILHVASRAVFGEPPAARTALAAWREALTPGLLRQLTWARLAPTRSFVQPVWQLERQTGRDARARSAVLGRRASGTAFWLTLVCGHLELVLMLSLDVLVTLFTPPEAGGSPGGMRGFFEALFGDEANNAFGLADFAFYVVAITIIEPLYVVSGLALYLNRRTQLEGWDIELAFRRMERRLAGRTVSGIVVALAATLALAGAVVPTDALAATPSRGAAVAAAARDPQDAVKEVLAAPEFQEYRKERTWKRKGERQRDTRQQAPFMPGLVQLLAELARLAAWIAAVVAVVALAWYARRFLRPESRAESAEAALPEMLFGLDVRPESLPDDPAAAALEHARAGRVREALSLLYRGALVALVHRHAVPLRESSTEGDAVKLGRRALTEGGGDYLGRLVEAWQATAYGGRPPPAAAAEKLALAWPAHFASRGGNARGADA